MEPLLNGIKPTLPHRDIKVGLKTEMFEGSEKLCCDTKAFLVMSEAEKVERLMKDRDEQILPVAVPGDEAFMKRNYVVMCFC